MKEIPGYPGYLASENGEIWSCRLGRLLTPSLRKGRIDYLVVSVVDANGRKRNAYVHRLICLAFHGLPLPGQMTRHLNGKALDVRSGNLAWGTQAENYKDSELHGTAAKGDRHGRAKLSTANVIEIRRLYAERQFSQQQLATKYRISRRSIQHALKPTSWANIQENI